MRKALFPLLLLLLLLSSCVRYEDIKDTDYVDTGITKVYITLNGAEVPSPDDEPLENLPITIVPSKSSKANINITDTLSGKMSEFQGRGNTTWSGGVDSYPPKKPYKFKIKKKHTPSESLLKEKVNGVETTYVATDDDTKLTDYTLLANYENPSLLNYTVALRLAEALKMEWNPAAEPVDLFFDGVYNGSYQLVDNRKAVANLLGMSEKGDDGAYGYLIEADTYYDKDPKFTSSEYSLPFMVILPKQKNITAHDVKDEVEADVNALEEELLSGNTEHFDLDSFASFFIINNLMYETDHEAPHSVFLYRKEIGKGTLCCGPIWDYSYATLTKKSDRMTLTGSYYFKTLLGTEEFKDKLKEKWDSLDIDEIKAKIDDEAEYIRKSWELDSYVWDRRNVWEYENFKTFDGYVYGLKSALEFRWGLLDAYVRNL